MGHFVFVQGLLSTSLRELTAACNSAAGRLCSCSIDVAVAARRKRHAESSSAHGYWGNSEKACLARRTEYLTSNLASVH